VHLTLRGRSTAEFPVEKAEVQIKTMLHDGWGAKTHDLTYKPEGEIEQSLHRHMEILGDVLQNLDDQSELIKDAIKERWNADRKQRELARDSLFLSLINRTGVPHAAELEVLAKEIYNRKSELGTMEFNDPVMISLVDKIDDLKARLGSGRDICRLYTLFASLRAAPDMLGTALNAIDVWQGSTTSEPLQQVGAANFRALTYYAVGMLDKAVQASRAALEIAGKAALPAAVIQTKSNLAYFLSELTFALPNRDSAMAGEARALSLEALQSVDPPPPLSAQDTRGAVLIALGENETEIREGLELCREARDRSIGNAKPVTEAYFHLHERRAFRRILSFE
jgi:tetratricopeptide (TPR) repeat protein